MTTTTTLLQDALAALLPGRAFRRPRAETASDDAPLRRASAGELGNHMRRDIGLPPLPESRGW